MEEMIDNIMVEPPEPRDFGYVIKFTDTCYNVFVDPTDYYSGYGVVPKEEDKDNLYDIEEVRKYCALHPDKVLAKHPMEDRIKLLREKESLEAWLRAHDYIGTKIATGRATADEYATEIAEMTTKSARINAIDAELKSMMA